MSTSRLKTPAAQAVTPILIGIAFFALVGLTLWGVAVWASSNSGPGSELTVNLGDNVFGVGSAERWADTVDSSGLPLLFPGLVNGSEQRAIGIYHTGTDPLTGWVAYSLVAPGSAETCVLQLDRDARLLTDPCTTKTFPPDGTGLTRYPTTVTADKQLVVDLGRGNPNVSAST